MEPEATSLIKWPTRCDARSVGPLSLNSLILSLDRMLRSGDPTDITAYALVVYCIRVVDILSEE